MEINTQQLDINPAGISHEIGVDTHQAFVDNDNLKRNELLHGMIRSLDINTLTVSFQDLSMLEASAKFYEKVGCAPIKIHDEDHTLTQLFIPLTSPLGASNFRIDHLKFEINRQPTNILHILDASLTTPYHPRDLLFAIPELKNIGLITDAQVNRFMQKVTTNSLGKNASILLSTKIKDSTYYMRIWTRSLCDEYGLQSSKIPKFTTRGLTE